MNTQALLDTQQIADTLSVSVRTIRKWQAAKIIPFFKVKRCVRFDLTKVMNALEEFEQKSLSSISR